LILISTSVLALSAWTGVLLKSPVFCPLRRFTGIPCGSCGLTRAIVALIHGDLMTAIHFHLAAPLLFLAGVLIVLISGAELVLDRDLLGPLWRRWGSIAIWLTLGIILMGWGINLAAYFGHPIL